METTTPTASCNEIGGMLSPIVLQLVELCNGPEDDEFGRLRPTRDAFDAAIQLLSDAALKEACGDRKIPGGCVSTDSEGGVRIEWITDRAGVHLVLPSKKSEPAYLYHELSGDYATEDASPEP